jgi:hypothetical protein
MPPNVAQAVQQAAANYWNDNLGANPPVFVTDPSTLQLAPDFEALQTALESAAASTTAYDVGALIQTAFGSPASSVAATAEFNHERTLLGDSVIVIVLLPDLHALPLDQMVDILRMMDIVERVSDGDTSLNTPSVLQAALSVSIVLPPSIFPLRRDISYPRIGDLLVVNQNLKRYELGEISSVENILLGETRKHSIDHTLSLDKTDTTSTDTTTQTTDELDTTEQFQLTNEAQNVINEDLSVQAGVTTSGKYGPVQLNTNANVAYNQSKSSSTQSSVEHAKDVTSRAVKNVTQNVYQQEIARRTETFDDKVIHNFANTGMVGQKNISGLYQWLNKVYEAQVFNYGKRMLLDFTIPEPAAFLIDAVTTADQTSSVQPPVPFVMVWENSPPPLFVGKWHPLDPQAHLNADGTIKKGLVTRPVNPNDLSLTGTSAPYYGHYVALYGASGIAAPPEPQITVSKAYAQAQDQNNHLSVSDNLTIPPGYQASSVEVNGIFNIASNFQPIDGDERMWVFVGKTAHEFSAYRGAYDNQPAAPTHFPMTSVPSYLTSADFAFKDDPATQKPTIDEVGFIPVAIQTNGASNIAVNVDVTCVRTQAALDGWNIATHGSIMQAYLKQVSDYSDAVAGQTFQKTTQGQLGTSDPSLNLEIVKLELKKACIALITDNNIEYVDDAFNMSDFNGINGPAAVPDPNDSDDVVKFLPQQSKSPSAEDQGAYIQFFEQVFEWENLTYLFYPYFWARKSQWQELALQTSTDADFLDFLKAGSARVVVAIRPTFEPLALFYLMTGQIWGGGGLNGIADAYYLPIADEIADQEGAGSPSIPQGDPWEVKVPTSVVKLRSDDSLPVWAKFTLNSANKWAPGDSNPAAGSEIWVPGEMHGGQWIPDYGSVDNNGNFEEP